MITVKLDVTNRATLDQAHEDGESFTAGIDVTFTVQPSTTREQPHWVLVTGGLEQISRVLDRWCVDEGGSENEFAKLRLLQDTNRTWYTPDGLANAMSCTV
jgi:hypothetical protein